MGTRFKEGVLMQVSFKLVMENLMCARIHYGTEGIWFVDYHYSSKK